MYWAYQHLEALHIDDVLAAHDKYNKSDFTHDGVEYLYVKGDLKVAPNFRLREFAGGCVSHPWIAKPLVLALQMLRDEYGAIRVNSTYRSHECNEQAGGASRSYHLTSQAIDFSFLQAGSHSRFKNDVESGACIVNSLRTIGVGGIGGYSGHYHIDIGRPRMWGSISGSYTSGADDINDYDE